MNVTGHKIYDCLVMPSKGIGTGLARLEKKAPETFAVLCRILKSFFKFDNKKGVFIDLDKYPPCSYDLSNIKRKTVETLSPKLLRENPNWLFVFGDNALRYGKGGQAVIRDEPNAFGIVTKLKPNNTNDSYMTDKSSYRNNMMAISKDIRWISKHLNVQLKSTIEFNERQAHHKTSKEIHNGN
jgi:hypothetical protein